MDIAGGTDADIKSRLYLGRTFSSLNLVWKVEQYSKELNRETMFNSNTRFVFLYCSELWRTTEKDKERLDTFHRKCLPRILKIHWPDKVSDFPIVYENT